jgi:integrase
LRKTEPETLLRVSSEHPRDHLIFSLALGTGLRLAEIVGLNVGDVFTVSGTPRSRIRLRREIAKGGRANDVVRSVTRRISHLKWPNYIDRVGHAPSVGNPALWIE